MKRAFFLALFAVWSLLGATSTRAQTASAAPPEATQPNSAPATATADEGKTTYNFETDFNSRYVFRGVASSAGPVVQPGFYLSKRGSTFGLWANINASRRGAAQAQARAANEVDVTYARTLERGRTTIEPAAVLYLYPTNIAPTTGELSLRLARKFKRFSIFSSHNIDVLKYEGAYFGEIGLGREREWSPRLSGASKISLGVANAKYNRNNIGARKSAFNVAALDLSLTYALGEKFYLRPHLGYTRILDRELRDSLDEPTIWNFALALGSDF